MIIELYIYSYKHEYTFSTYFYFYVKVISGMNEYVKIKNKKIF